MANLHVKQSRNLRSRNRLSAAKVVIEDAKAFFPDSKDISEEHRRVLNALQKQAEKQKSSEQVKQIAQLKSKQF